MKVEYRTWAKCERGWFRCRRFVLPSIASDGTLEVSQGPISINLLYELVSKGHQVIIVSPSPFCVGIDLPHYSPLFTRRHENLIYLKTQISADRYVYVGDQFSDEIAAKTAGGWDFCPASEFEAFVREI